MQMIGSRTSYLTKVVTVNLKMFGTLMKYTLLAALISPNSLSNCFNQTNSRAIALYYDMISTRTRKRESYISCSSTRPHFSQQKHCSRPMEIPPNCIRKDLYVNVTSLFIQQTNALPFMYVPVENLSVLLLGHW